MYFGGSADSIAEQDRARMQRNNQSLGIESADDVDDLREPSTSFSVEKTNTAED